MKQQDEIWRAFTQIKNTCIQNNTTSFAGTHVKSTH